MIVAFNNRYGSGISELFADLLSSLGLLLKLAEVVSTHTVHNEKGDPHVPDCEEEPVPPNLKPHGSSFHLRFVVFGEPLACVDLLNIGNGASSGKVTFLDDLSLEIPLICLFLGGEDECGIEPA